jgi:NADH dehydrogenase
MSGFFAWLAWLALHITVLIGFRNRFSVLISWIYSYVFVRRGSRLITRSVPAQDITPARQSQPVTQPP